MQWILVTGYTFLILALLPRIPFFRLPAVPIPWIQCVFLLKVLAGIGLGIIYSHYYTDRSTADTFKFFDDSRIIFNALRDSPGDFLRMLSGYHSNSTDLEQKYYVHMTAWNNRELFFNDNRSIIRINVFFQFISLGNYYVHVVLLNLFSFTGLICLYKVFAGFPGQKKQILFCALFLFPSVLFWGSGLLKDSILMFSVGLTLFFFTRLNTKINFINLAGMAMGITGLLLNKFYILFLLLPGLLAYLLSKQKKENAFWIFSGMYLLFALLLFSSKYISPHFDLLAILETKRRDFAAIAISGKALHLLPLPTESLTAFSFIKQIPRAFGTVLLRPFIWEADSIPVFFSALENLLIVAAGLLSIIFPSASNKKDLLILLSAFFIFSLFTLIGMITPILGAIVRYRIIGIPFLLFIIIYCMDISRLRQFISGKTLTSK
ncbi:MAG TPA: hypothetical protein PLU53_04680 [Bacteroidia bacterium]|nr:hypothetical protein [Bacteroidia bacterium]